ncbi:universal stress protein [Catalinimonas sp. 4WD22]|uniref:universal stress protein n=1 Tax=Catalinimonas locisalis TaxID=3133978 RepID=UPI003101465B
MKILVPIDFSADAFEALRYAITLARQWNTVKQDSPELFIFHAFHLPVGGDATFFIDNAMLEREELHVQNKMQSVINKLPEIQALPYQLITRMAMPAEGIRQVVKDEKIQLVVMGNHGMDDPLSNWLGNTTLQMMKHLHCPVLAVPQSTATLHPKQVGFATDLENAGESFSLSLFKELLQIWRADLHIIHVHPKPSKIGVAQAEEALSLDHIFHDVPHTYDFPEDKDPAQGISHYLQEHKLDLLAITPRKHNALENLFHKSVCKYLASHTTVPLISLPNNNSHEN